MLQSVVTSCYGSDMTEDDILKKLRRLTERMAQAQRDRDDWIIQAKRQGLPATAIADATNLSRVHVYRILNSAAEEIGREGVQAIMDDDMRSQDVTVRLGAKLGQIPGFAAEFSKRMEKLEKESPRPTYVCKACKREFPVGPRSDKNVIYDRAMAHIANKHNKVGAAVGRELEIHYNTDN